MYTSNNVHVQIMLIFVIYFCLFYFEKFESNISIEFYKNEKKKTTAIKNNPYTILMVLVYLSIVIQT